MAVNRSYENKEMIQEINCLVIYNRKIREVCCIRFYMGRSSSATTMYCNAWFFGKDDTKSGSGSAGGGGYDKKSASFQEAMDKAGIQSNIRVSGRGMETAKEAVKAWAKKQGYNVNTFYCT